MKTREEIEEAMRLLRDLAYEQGRGDSSRTLMFMADALRWAVDAASFNSHAATLEQMLDDLRNDPPVPRRPSTEGEQQ